jgi:hypothetical protein
VLFVGGCLLTPPAFAALEAGGSSRALGYFADPFLLGSLFLTGAAAWVTSRSPERKPLSLRDHRAALWYLLNGTVIHILMDGLVGAFHVLPLMNENYEKLDLRFTRPWGDERGSCILSVSLMELFVKGPLCILLFHAYHTRKSYTDALELLVCALQLYGCIMFSGTELLHGMSNLPVDWNLEFTKEHLLHFWFAFVVCEPIWIVVPIWLGWRAFQRATEAAVAAARKPGSSARKSKRT